MIDKQFGSTDRNRELWKVDQSLPKFDQNFCAIAKFKVKMKG